MSHAALVVLVSPMTLSVFPPFVMCFIEVSHSCVIFIFLLSQRVRGNNEKEEEERIIRERDTFENVYIFTMWHHPKSSEIGK